MPSFSEMLSRLQSSDAARPFPMCPGYIVTRDGRVANRAGTGWLRPCAQKRGGYLAVSLWTDGRSKTWTVHQLVALTFNPPRPSPRHDAAHKDGDRLNNNADNLAWKTRKENEADKVTHGTASLRGRFVARKLTEPQAREIHRRGSEGPRGIKTALAAEFGVSITHVGKIISGERWSNHG